MATSERSWVAKPAGAFGIRMFVAVVPVLVSYLAARMSAPGLWRPDGWVGTTIYVSQMAVIGCCAALVTDRALRRALPLASLLQMTLVFPDRAPSRFGLALRSGTVGKLMAANAGQLSSDHQEAAEQVVAMVGELGRHERLTRGHTERVRAYADLIGEELGLSDGDRHMLSWAAIAHDVGKLAVPAELLSKTEVPTGEEWEIIRTHPVVGARMLEPLSGWLGPWRFAARDHHERWDGNGYPAGLAADEISMAGRIVAVADAFDVITCNRSYKTALTVEVAREELVRCAGVQFDPAVVRALLQASLDHRRPRLGLFGWLPELAGLSTLTRGVSQAVAVSGAAVVVAIGAAGVRPDVEELAVVPISIELPSDPIELPFTDTPDTVASPSSTTAPPSTSAVADSDVLRPPDIDRSTVTSTSLSMSPESTTATSPSVGPDTTFPTTTSTDTTASTDTTPPTSTTPTTEATTTSTAATTTTTVATTTTTSAVPSQTAWEFGSGGVGDASSQAFLPLTGSLQNGALPNYDTDRDSDQGLTVDKGDGLSESDSSKMQRWRADAEGSRLSGWGTFTIFVATKDFDTGKTGRFVVGLYDCDASGAGCTALATGSASFDQANFGGGFGAATVNFGALDHTFGAGRTFVLKIATASDSDDDLWFAYGTNTFPARLDIA